MNKYQVYVDIPDEETGWEDPQVIDFIIEAKNPNKARELAAAETEKAGYYDYYVWEVSNEDIIKDE